MAEKKRKFVYFITRINALDMTEENRILDKIGKEGWELIQVIATRFYFKKEV